MHTREEYLLASSEGDKHLKCPLHPCAALEWVDGQTGKERVLGRAEWEKRGTRIIDICRGIIMPVNQEVQGGEEGWRSGAGAAVVSILGCRRLRGLW